MGIQGFTSNRVDGVIGIISFSPAAKVLVAVLTKVFIAWNLERVVVALRNELSRRH
jgi:hypothetical protein